VKSETGVGKTSYGLVTESLDWGACCSLVIGNEYVDFCVTRWRHAFYRDLSRVRSSAVPILYCVNHQFPEKCIYSKLWYIPADIFYLNSHVIWEFHWRNYTQFSGFYYEPSIVCYSNLGTFSNYRGKIKIIDVIRKTQINAQNIFNVTWTADSIAKL